MIGEPTWHYCHQYWQGSQLNVNGRWVPIPATADDGVSVSDKWKSAVHRKNRLFWSHHPEMMKSVADDQHNQQQQVLNNPVSMTPGRLNPSVDDGDRLMAEMRRINVLLSNRSLRVAGKRSRHY